MSETGSLHGVLAIVVPSFTRLTCMAGTDACSKLTVSEAFGPILCNFDGFDENRPVLTLSPNASLAGERDTGTPGAQCIPCRFAFHKTQPRRPEGGGALSDTQIAATRKREA